VVESAFSEDSSGNWPIEHLIDGEKDTATGWSSFEEAVQVGNKEFMEEALEPIEEDRRDAYFWLDVSEARQEGIWPIPWR
jgi:hypothetical protein